MPRPTTHRPSVTFEQAAVHHFNTQLPDEFILGALAGKLRKPGSKKEAFFLKSFLDNVPPDESDVEFMSNNDEVIRFRDELTDFVAQELKFLAPPEYRDYLIQRRQEFREKLEDDKQRFRRYVAGREQGLDLRQNRVPVDALDFHGMDVPVDNGRNVDLLEGNTPSNIHANLFIQREIAGTFVHWTSKDYLRGRLNGNKPKLSRRIYLNPRTRDAVRIFKTVIDTASAAGLSVKAKILDRTMEANVMKSYDDQDASARDIRGDAIVLYANEEEGDVLLGIAEKILKENPDAFRGREVSSVPLRLADGIAIGDEPEGEKGASLTSHRAQVLEATVAQVREADPSTKEEKIRLFRGLWHAAAHQANINPHNIAFNTRKPK